MARSTKRSNQRPDTLMQDRFRQVDETSCNARPDHTFGSFSTERAEFACQLMSTSLQQQPALGRATLQNRLRAICVEPSEIASMRSMLASFGRLPIHCPMSTFCRPLSGISYFDRVCGQLSRFVCRSLLRVKAPFINRSQPCALAASRTASPVSRSSSSTLTSLAAMSLCSNCRTI